MADTKLAKIGITIKEPWADNISYEPLDFTFWRLEDGGDGCGYIAKRANIGIRPGTDDSVWGKATEHGASIYDLAVKYGHFVGTEEEFEAEYQAVLKAARDAASETSATNTEIQAAEELRKTAENARVEAENARQTAESARQTAETARETAESGRQTAEAQRSENETTRQSRETARQNAEQTRQSNENARESAERERTADFEGLKTDMQTAIQQADAATAAANEINRTVQQNEASRQQAESGRATAETQRGTNESTRQTQESTRQTAESTRDTQETARQTAEQGRASAESGRVSAEQSRVTAETAREEQYTFDHQRAESDHETAANDHTQALADHQVMSGYDTRLTNAETEVSQLRQDVTDLDAKVDTLPVKDVSVYTEVSVPDTDLTVGKVVNKNYGTDANFPGSPSMAATGYIEIPDGTVRIEWLTAFKGDANFSDNGAPGAGLYDANKTYLGANYYSATNIFASLPAGAKYVRFSTLTELTDRKVRFYSKYVPERETITETRVENITLEENKRLYRNYVSPSAASTPAYCAEIKYHPIFAGAETLNHNCRTNSATNALIPVADETSVSVIISLVLYDENLDVVVATDRSDIKLSDYPTARYYRIGNFTGDTTRQVTQYIYQHDIEDDVKQLQDTALELGKPLYKSPYELEEYGGLKVVYFHQQKDTAVWGAGYYLLGSNSVNGRVSRYIPVQNGDKFAFCLENYYGANYSVFVLVDAYLNEVDCSQNYTWTVDGKLYSGTYEVARDDAAYIIFASSFNTYNTAGGIKDKFRLVKLEGYSDNDTVKRSGFVYDAMVAKLRAMEDALNANNITDTLAPVDYVARANEIKSAVDGLGLANKFSFALFTDPHFGGANTGDTLNTMPRLMKAVTQMSDAGIVDFVATLGDNIDNNNETRWTEFKAYLASMGVEYAIAVGNHDLLKPSVLRNGQTTITGAVIGSSHNDTWYYFDKSGIRFIVLNGVDNGADDDADSMTRAQNYNGFSTYQMDWLISTLTTSLPVVILTHYGLAATYTEGGWSIAGGNGYETVIDVVEGFINGTSGSVTIGETAIPFDFTEQGEGNVIGVFCGHMHGDRVQFKDELFYNIWLDNALAFDSIGANGYSQGNMVPGTVSEVAMDIVTIDLDTFKIYTHRLGRGADRVVEN